MGKKILQAGEYLDRLWTYSDKLGEQWQLLKQLRAEHFDVVIDCMNNPRSVFYTYYAKAKRSIGFTSLRSFLYTDQVQRPEGGMYIVKEKFLLLEALGFHPQDSSLWMPYGEEDTKVYASFCERESAFKEADFKVLISPTHRRHDRRWPLANFAELADCLQQKWGAKVLWICGPGEEGVLAAVGAKMQTPFLQAPMMNLREMLVLMKHCQLFIGNSNGPSHIAVASGIPSLQLHGPTEPMAWCPNTPQQQSVYGVEDWPGPCAIDGISVGMVLARLQLVLAGANLVIPR